MSYEGMFGTWRDYMLEEAMCGTRNDYMLYEATFGLGTIGYCMQERTH